MSNNGNTQQKQPALLVQEEKEEQLPSASELATGNQSDCCKPDETVLPKKEKSVKDHLVSRRRRQALIVVSSLYNFLFVGAFFGWGPMQLLLESNGSLSSKCSEQESNNIDNSKDNFVCPAQTAALINIHFVATTTQILSPVFGIVCDWYGAPTVAYAMVTCILVAWVLLVVAVEFLIDPLLYVAFVIMSLGTWFGALLMTQTGMYFSGQTQHRVIVALNSLFDSGAATYLALWYIYEAIGGAVSSVLLGYLCLAIVVLSAAAYLWAVVEPDEASIYGSVKLAAETHHLAVELEEVKKDNDSASKNNNLEVEQQTPPVSKEAKDRYVLIRDRTQIQQMTCGPSLLVTLFFVIQCTSNQWAMTTARDFLAALGDDEVDNRYLTIFQLMMPASLLALPLVDHIRKTYGFAAGFQVVNVLAIGYNTIRLASDNLNVQVFGFVLFSCFRCFLFGLVFSFIPTLLSPPVVGKATGIMMALPGITSFLNVALTRITVLHLDGDFFVPNLFYTLLTLPCIVAVHFIGKAEIQEARALKMQQEPAKASEE